MKTETVPVGNIRYSPKAKKDIRHQTAAILLAHSKGEISAPTLASYLKIDIEQARDALKRLLRKQVLAITRQGFGGRRGMHTTYCIPSLPTVP